MNLTDKQEKFVLGLIEGKSQRKAYIDAGYSTNGKSEKFIDQAASRLYKNSKVYTRYEQLKSEVAEQSKWTRLKAFEEYEWLKNIAKNEIEKQGIRKPTADAFISSLEGMNKMAFTNDELANKKIEKEIELLSKKIDQMNSNGESSTENALADALIKMAGGTHDI
ncbi:terminase [Macrococcus bovicus]|uniref:Terminase n=2 Tax=Macrococcus bovicus TaxID=69968 RepID=A0A4R6BWB3_9STAP|nr:terminase [Macrococcus bovicus]